MIKHEFKPDIKDLPVNILGIVGSPRKNSNSSILMSEAVRGALSYENVHIEKFSFHQKKIKLCNGCEEYCTKNKKCIYDDDFEEFKNKWLNADAIIWSVPVYTMGPPSINRAAIERLEKTILIDNISKGNNENFFPYHLKPSGAIAQGSSRFGGQEIVIGYMMDHFMKMGCLPVTGDMPHCHIGVAGHVVDKESPEKDYQLLENCYSLGKRTVEMARIVKLGKIAINDQLKVEVK